MVFLFLLEQVSDEQQTLRYGTHPQFTRVMKTSAVQVQILHNKVSVMNKTNTEQVGNDG